MCGRFDGVLLYTYTEGIRPSLSLVRMALLLYKQGNETRRVQKSSTITEVESYVLLTITLAQIISLSLSLQTNLAATEILNVTTYGEKLGNNYTIYTYKEFLFETEDRDDGKR